METPFTQQEPLVSWQEQVIYTFSKKIPALPTNNFGAYDLTTHTWSTVGEPQVFGNMDLFEVAFSPMNKSLFTFGKVQIVSEFAEFYADSIIFSQFPFATGNWVPIIQTDLTRSFLSVPQIYAIVQNDTTLFVGMWFFSS
jgi:hypothetical protein